MHRETRITIMVTKSERELIGEFASSYGLGISEFIRMLILREAQKEGFADSLDIQESKKDARRKREGFRER